MKLFRCTGILFALALIAGCGGGGASGGSSQGTPQIVDTPLGSETANFGEVTSEEDDLLDADPSRVIGTTLDCTDNADGGLKGCWRQDACVATDNDYWLRVYAEFRETDSEKIADFAGYFYRNASCTGGPALVRRPSDELSFRYSTYAVTGPDYNGLTDIHGLAISVRTNGVRNFLAEGVYYLSPSDRICFSSNILLGVNKLTLQNNGQPNFDIDLDNCFDRGDNS